MTGSGLAPLASPEFTLKALAQDKGLPLDFLKSLGLHDLPKGGVGIPYKGASGQVVAVKQRTALAAKEGSYWPSGLALMPYGLERLPEARENGLLVLAEGESDTWSLWFHGICGLGLPGSSSAKCLEAEHLEGIERIYVFREPDMGGTRFVEGIARRLKELGWN